MNSIYSMIYVNFYVFVGILSASRLILELYLVNYFRERREDERTLMDSMKVLLCLVSFFTVLGEC